LPIRFSILSLHDALPIYSFSLFARFESKLEQYRGNLERSAVELAKDWRTDRILRRLEAMLIVLDKGSTFLLSGNGDLIEPDDGRSEEHTSELQSRFDLVC